jgi:type II secretory pathway component PulF
MGYTPRVSTYLAAYRQLDDGRHRTEFYRMWYAAAHAGFTNEKAFQAMGPRSAPHVEEMRLWLLDGARRGQRVTYLVETGGARFEPMERAILKLGEESGTFVESLRLLADFYHSKHRLILWIKKQMAYPMFSALCMVFIAPFPLLYFGQNKAYAGFVITGSLAWIVSGGTFVMAVAQSYGKRPPLVRARFARALATAVEAGLPLPRAIRLSAEAAADPELSAFVARFDEHGLQAGSLAETFAGAPHMSADMIGALAIADRTGDFSSTLRRLAELYEDGFR